MIINPRERAVSVDINRLQAFGAAGPVEQDRYLIDGQTSPFIGSNGVILLGVGGETPLRGTVLGGLLFQVQNGTINGLVTPGVLLVASPDSPVNVDDSLYKRIVDAGIAAPTPGFVLTPNASGLPRWDVVECAVTDSLLESDNRDIFDPSTGLFTPVTVDKVRESRLQYRIRIGVPGAGFPGVVSGWMPIATMLVPNGTTNFDTVFIWDVRPLAADRCAAPLNQTGYTHKGQQFFETSNPISNVSIRILGTIDGWVDAYRIGGKFNNLNVTSALLQEPGFSTAPGQRWYLYMAVPFGLPRWAGYLAAPLARVPGDLRGLPLVSNVRPDFNNTPFHGATMPAAYGLGALVVGNTDRYAQHMCGGYFSSTGDWISSFSNGGDVQYFTEGSQGGTNGAQLLPHVSHTNDEIQYNLIGVDPNAVEVLVTFNEAMDYAGAGSCQIEYNLTMRDGTGQVVFDHYFQTGQIVWPPIGGLGTVDLSWSVWVPVPSLIGAGGLGRLTWAHNANTNSAGDLTHTVGTTPTAEILAYRYGPLLNGLGCNGDLTTPSWQP